MTTYITRRPMKLNKVDLAAGDPVPDDLMTKAGIVPDSWVDQGHLLKLTAAEARSLTTLKEKRDKAEAEAVKAIFAYQDKLAELTKRKGNP